MRKTFQNIKFVYRRVVKGQITTEKKNPTKMFGSTSLDRPIVFTIVLKNPDSLVKEGRTLIYKHTMLFY